MAGSIDALMLSRSPYGGITNMEKNVNRQSKQDWHPCRLLRTHFWCIKLGDRFYGSGSSPFVAVCGGPDFPFFVVPLGKKGWSKPRTATLVMTRVCEMRLLGKVAPK